jgi:diadenosine tetraphosphate (Ap4A) HIT family hydrolase
VFVDEPVVDCFVCRKHQDATLMPGGPIAADDLAVVSHVSPRAPGTTSGVVYLGHLVVEPRRHAPGWADLRDDEAGSLGRWCSRAARALTTVTGAELVYSASIGHRIPHLHVHLLPRYPQTPAGYQWHRVDEWPEGQGTEDQAAALADQLRHALPAQP